MRGGAVLGEPSAGNVTRDPQPPALSQGTGWPKGAGVGCCPSPAGEALANWFPLRAGLVGRTERSHITPFPLPMLIFTENLVELQQVTLTKVTLP